MAKALEYPVVFAALLGGGHVCVKHPVIGTEKYTVHPGSGQILCLGHITEKQFDQLVKYHIITELPKGNKDKGGNIYRYWCIEKRLSGGKGND